MEFIDIDIEALIPHRDQMRLLEGVIAVDDEKAVTVATVTEAWPLYREGSVDILVTIELVAQTAALLEGYKRSKSKRGGATGWLVGIKKADFRVPRLSVPTTLVTEAARSYALEGYAVFTGTVSSGAGVVASMQIQALRPEEPA
jgi:predicted hotdog family 3-hydroxylacyl-ACP dehydratase